MAASGNRKRRLDRDKSIAEYFFTVQDADRNKFFFFANDKILYDSWG